MKFKLSLPVVLFALLTGTSAFAGQRYLGSVPLTTFDGRDAITLPACGTLSNPNLRAVQLRVSQAPADIELVRVTFGNGQIEYLPIREQFLPGSETRWVQLMGGSRCIQRIAVIGHKGAYSPNHPAVVSLFGWE